MRFSIGITDFSWPDALTGELTRVAVAAEDTGLDTVWVLDHLMQADPHSTADSAMLEAYTTLGFLAARTSRVGLGTMVSPNRRYGYDMIVAEAMVRWVGCSCCWWKVDGAVDRLAARSPVPVRAVSLR